jgi:hypothetical protein
MVRSKSLTAIFVLFLFFLIHANVNAATNRNFKSKNYKTLSVSYFSWGEKVMLSQSGRTDHAHANLLGNALNFEIEHYFRPRYGFIFMGSLFYGIADVGGTQNYLAYNLSNQNWSGAGIETHFAYRFSQWLIGTVGPIAVYRPLSLPVSPSGTSAKFGSSFNFGGTFGLKMQLNKHFEIREEIGALATNASTYWAISLGYKF